MMYAFYGWAFVGWDLIVKEKLQEYIDQCYDKQEDWNVRISIHAVNGIVQMTASGCRNRKESDGGHIFRIFEYLGHLNSDAYGLLYIQNDWELENEFQVYVLKRGKLEERRDPFLSPLIPVVEDPWNPDSDEGDD